MTREILEKIIGNFSRDELAVFFRKKSTKFTQKMESLDGYDGDKFGKFAVLGEIELKDRFKLVVVAVEKNDSLTERDSRKKQFELAKKIMQEQRFAFHAAAIFVFHDKKGAFRFSLIHRQYKGTKVEFGPFRRFTYFVSPQESNRTFLNRIGDASFESLEEIRDAFSVERVNKEFYRNIALFFDRFMERETYKREHRKKEFAVKLIGRLIFCWFLKKKKSIAGKSLLPEALLSLKAVGEYRDYFHAVLEPLFFEVLNTPMDKRDPKALLQIALFADDIPFLNGGLFEPDEDDVYTRKTGATYGSIAISDEWFRDLFDLFSQYNFTIDENTPVDVELSIDPEMLGRVFENLLAEKINPETGESARNATGSFYTPRPIVEYMVDASLSAYLSSKSGLDDRTLKTLLSWSEDAPALTKDQKNAVIDALDKMKSLDPACGSGAFPMGVLQKTALVLEKVDPQSIKWVMKMLDRIPDSYVRTAVEDQLQNEDWSYIHKLGIIQNSIYGVDIQPIAVEISKLRFFLSLIVDAKIDDKAKNRGVKPLPNLEFKIVCADTLYRSPEPHTIETFFGREPFFVELERLVTTYFGANEEGQKLKLKKAIEDHIGKKVAEKKAAINDLLKPQRGTRFENYWNEKNKAELERLNRELEMWDSYINIFKHQKVEFFEIRYFFPDVKDGFDIVIGNPPYIQLQSNHGILAEKYASQQYLSFARTGDIYCLFYERGDQLLREGGHLCFITSNKWMRAKYGEKMRAYFLYRFPVRQIIDFGDSQIFEAATTYTNILLAEKVEPKGDGRKLKQFPVTAKVWDLSKTFSLKFSLEEMLAENDRYAPEFTAESFLIIGGAMKKIKERIEQVGTPLREWEVQINRGILTGFNEAFIIDGATKDRLIKQDPKSVEIIKPLLRGRDIKKYRIEYADQWLINTHNGYGEVSRVNIDDYPAVKKHLDRYGEEISKRYDKGDTPYNLRNCAYVEDFEKEKIAWGNLAQEPGFAWVPEGFHINAPSPFFVTKSKYLLGVMNSSVSWWYLKQITAGREGGFFEIKPMYIEQLPIPKPNASEPAFELLVDCIQFCYEHDLTSEAELFTDVVDYMVFDLYFEKEMKEGDCYISNRVMEVVAEHLTKKNRKGDQRHPLRETAIALYAEFIKDTVVQRGLRFGKTVSIVKSIQKGGA